jgi:purine-binding chemotaxis protein CheW
MDVLNNTISFLVFTMQKQRFAIDVSSVLEVLENQTVALVPQTPVQVRGVVNFRGDILPIIDFRLILNLKPATLSEVIIVMDINNGKHKLRIGAVADTVLGVSMIPERSIEPLPDINLDFPKDYASGVFKENSKFVYILNIDKALTLDNIVA